ncbi:MAG: ribosome maturation factor RimP [Clostridiales bacterium]|nr:ribosome maturation factor RimP [Clostridiales bacterium]MBR0468876.1 ribosome maturation factor RimP [Mogibacterium sp.]
MAKEDISGRVSEMLTPFLDENGLELYKAEYKKEGPSWVLRVCLEKPADADNEYVSIDECEKVNSWLSDRLDSEDLIDRSYSLEVGSAGLDRELIKDSDYVRFAGRAVEVRTYEQINGSKEHEGTLKGKENGAVTIITDAGELSIPADKISKINLAVVF